MTSVAKAAARPREGIQAEKIKAQALQKAIHQSAHFSKIATD